MNTTVYKILEDKLIESGLSKREFAKKYNLSHAWFIEFMNLDKPFRPMQVKTMSALHHTFGINIEDIKEYNKWVLEERGK